MTTSIRPFGQRLFMVLWILAAALFCAIVVGSLQKPLSFRELVYGFWIVLAAIYVPLCLLQFLFLGYGNPSRLFRGDR